MMRGRVASTRRRRAYTAPSTPQKDSTDVEKKEKGKRRDKKSVQWASGISDEFSTAPLRKCKSDGFYEFDQALKKLTKVSSILDKTATLDKDYEENLQSIQEKLKTELDLKSAENN